MAVPQVRVAADSIYGSMRLVTILLVSDSDLLIEFPREFSVSTLSERTSKNAVITATEWDCLLDPSDGPEWSGDQEIIHLIRSELSASEPQFVSEGEWHLPFIDDKRNGSFELTEEARLLSADRCASAGRYYLGEAEVKAQIMQSELRIEDGHLSSFEHIATPFTNDEARIRNTGQLSARAWATKTNRSFDRRITQQMMFSDNFRGWTSMRRTLMNERLGF